MSLGDPRSRSHGVNVTFLGQGHPKVKGQYLGFALISQIYLIILITLIRAHVRANALVDNK